MGMVAVLNQEYPLVPQKVYLLHLSKNTYRHAQKLEFSMAASGILKTFGVCHSFSKVYLTILSFT